MNPVDSAGTAAELEALRSRLEELEETLRAIRGGEVDALVVDTSGGERVYTLESADRPYRTFVERMQQGAVTVSSGGFILYANRGFGTLLGVDEGQLLGSPFLARVAPESREALAGCLSGSAPGFTLEEVTFVRDDGRTVAVQVTGSRHEDGAVRLVVTDLSGSRREAALEQRVRERTTELEESNSQMLAFSYSVAHDLRAPVRAIRGYLDALLEDLGEAVSPVVQRHGERIAEATIRMDQLIQDLLAYSRANQTELVHEPTDPAAVVQLALEGLSDQIRETGATVQDAVPRELPPVMAHPPTLVLVISNLVANAIKFVPEGVSPRVTMRGEQNNGAVRLWVEDNGLGIAPEHQERIFRVFEQLHPRDRFPGTGVGLAMVRKAMDRMGGRVGVESQAGAGSRFWIELPALQGAPDHR